MRKIWKLTKDCCDYDEVKWVFTRNNKKQQEDYEECVIHRDYTHLPKVSDKDVGLSSS